MSGTIAARVAMGAVCDWIGPRLGMSSVLMMTAPCIFGMALANKALDFILLRFGIGFGLSTFVSCQFWTASMFNVKIVGALLHCCAHCTCIGKIAGRFQTSCYEHAIACRQSSDVVSFVQVLPMLPQEDGATLAEVSLNC